MTFTTIRRRYLAPAAREIALDCCIHDHRVTFWLHSVVIMPDHVHMLFSPHETWSLDRIMRRVKGVSARRINQVMGQHGPLWQDESFDRILRSNEDLRKKGEYIAQNPIRAGLVTAIEEYPWIWRQWIDDQN